MIEPTIESQPTAVLSQEHQVILRMLKVFERILDEADATGHVDGADSGEVLDFLRTFADRCHHFKEEDLLFPSLLGKGLPGEQGPVAVMLMEHREGRSHVRELTLQLDAAAKGDAEALSTFSGCARAHAALLRDHIAKEDQVLFPLAERALDPRTKQELLRAFEEAETLHHPGTHERMLDIARRLCRKYGIGDEPIATSCSGFQRSGAGP